MTATDSHDWPETNDPSRKSWVESANTPDTDFPIQKLPIGVFSDASNASPRAGVAIGDAIVDLSALAREGLLGQDASLFAQPSLNAFIATGRAQWRTLRGRAATRRDRTQLRG
jgi:fumarylacetoacetase